jgi:hypothetical protein
MARHEHDFYETPQWATEAMISHFGMLHGDVLDAGCGTGAIGGVVRRECRPAGGEKYIHSLDGVDIQDIPEEHRPIYKSFFKEDFMGFGKPQMYTHVVANPPYKHALEFIQRAMWLAPNVTMLLRLNFLEGRKRLPFFQKHTPDVLVLSRRPSFTGDGKTDATAYAWMRWQAGNPGGKFWIV